MPRAASLADTLKHSFGTDPELEAGSGGVFDVVVDGRTIFSKHNEGGDFPDEQEIVRRIRARNPA